MSEFIRILNAIKTHWDLSWLTDSQQQCLKELQSQLRVPRTVNLYGKQGVGKTFLAWALARGSGLAYFPHLTLFWQVEDLDNDAVIIDNCLSVRSRHRDVLKALDFRGVKRAVLITPTLIQDYTHYCELLLTSNDVSKVQDNLESIGISTEVTDVSSLWSMVNPYCTC